MTPEPYPSPRAGENDPDHDDQGNGQSGSGTAVVSKPTVKAKEPAMYKVLLHNDDYTPMDFVVQILESVFHLDHTKAHKIMLDVHNKGTGCCGVYPYELAEVRVALVMEAARENEYPLKCSMEKE